MQHLEDNQYSFAEQQQQQKWKRWNHRILE